MQVAIVGAGMAGLAAAHALAAHGLDIEVFEASDRVGGRVHTIHDADTPLPVELGPEFVHGEPDATMRYVREAGLELDRASDVHHESEGGTLRRAGDVFARLGDLLDRATDQLRDESAAAYRARMPWSADDGRLFASLVEGFYAAPLDDISVQSVAADASRGEGGQAHVRGGYGRLAAWFQSTLARSGVSIHLGRAVRAIHWGGKHVELALADGETAIAARAIVTLSVGVLKAHDVRFVPGLGEHAAALDALAMGQVVKPVLCFRERIAPRDVELVHADRGPFPAFWLRSLGDAHQLVAWAGGPHAIALAGKSPDELAALAHAAFGAAIGERLPPFAHFHYRAYDDDPHTRGAYSYARVGGTSAGAQLARPLNAQLYFAGEATDAEYEGTVAGALASGRRAADQILDALGT